MVIAIAALYMLGIGNLSSVHYPRAMNPERVSQGGAASRWQALVFIFYPLALLPIFLAYVARVVFSSETIFLIVLAFAGVLGVVIYRIAMESAVEAAFAQAGADSVGAVADGGAGDHGVTRSAHSPA